MALSQYPRSNRKTLIVLALLCIAGFVANGTMVTFARQAQLRSIDQQQREDAKELTQNTERVTELQKRVDEIQQQKLADRVTRLEAIAETNHSLLITVAASIGILMLETTLRLLATLNPLKKKVG